MAKSVGLKENATARAFGLHHVAQAIETAKKSSYSRRFKAKPSSPKLLIILLTILSGLFIAAGVVHILQEPTNPASYLVFFFFTTPFVTFTYYEAHEARSDRGQKTLIFAVTELLSLATLGVTLSTPQEFAAGAGPFTLTVWTVFLALFWFLAMVGYDYCLDHEILRWLKRTAKNLKQGL
jgi:hypothetical protein